MENIDQIARALDSAQIAYSEEKKVLSLPKQKLKIRVEGENISIQGENAASFLAKCIAAWKPRTSQAPQSRWFPIGFLPQEISPGQPCAVVWQDSEHETDQGLQITTFQKITEGTFDRDRVTNAWWTNLTDALHETPANGWVETNKFATSHPEEDDWEERGIVAWKENGEVQFEETNLYQVKDGDSPQGWWLNVMDTPPMG